MESHTGQPLASAASSSSNSYPAPYGHACSNCTKCKSKCMIRGPGLDSCERCHRLKKICQPSSGVRKRKAANRSPPAKFTQLAQHPGGLVTPASESGTTIQQTVIVSTISDPVLLSPESSLSQNPGPSSENLRSSWATQDSDQNDEATRLSDSWPGPQPHPSISSPNLLRERSSKIPLGTSLLEPGAFEPSLTEAEALLTAFRNDMAKYFPIVIISPGMTAQQLRVQRPFQWLCIMAICSKSSTQQSALGRRIRSTMGEQILLDGIRNLDILTGTLIFTSWAQFYFLQKPITSNLIHLAMALLCDLGLNRPPTNHSAHVMLHYDAHGWSRPFNQVSRTIEERRAAVGCFLLSSVVSNYFRKTDTMLWSTYLDECLDVLAEAKEEPTDLLLTQLVRLQLIVEKTAQAPWNSASGGPMEMPWLFYLKSLQTTLNDLKRGIPPELQHNETLLFHLHSTEISIHEVALSRSSTLGSGPVFHRLETLCSCLQAVKDWFGAFLSVLPADYPKLSLAIITQLPHCIVSLHRLSTLKDNIWDQSLVRQTADLSLILAQLIEKMSRVKNDAGLDYGMPEDNDIFSAICRMMRLVKNWWDSKINSSGYSKTATTPVAIAVVEGSEQNLFGDFDLSDDAWLREVFDISNFQDEKGF